LLVNLLGKGDNPLADHGTKDAQHNDVVVVELGDMLGEHGLLVKVALAKVNVTVEGVVHEIVVCSFDISPEVEMRG
jgi:hypothetical protein